VVNDQRGAWESLRLSARARLVLVGTLASGGSMGSLWLAVAGAAPLLIATPFFLGGLAAALCARNVPSGVPSEAPNATKVDTSSEEARRRRHQDINAATTTFRSQVIYGLLGLTLLFVGAPAGILAAAGLYAAAFLFGIALLILLWLHWRSAWKYHRTIPGMVGVSTNWPTGSLSPADRRFLTVLIACAAIWYVSLTILALASHVPGQAAIISTTLVVIGLPLMWSVRAIWLKRP
jgi:hypothetical protein